MIKNLICKLFGHVHVEEMYAAPLAYQEHRYVVIKECNCARCGKNISFKMSEPMLEKPLYFNPFGQTGFAPVGHNIIAPCKVLVQGSKLGGFSCL